ncbi:PIN domain-containing protein [Scheffersomyces xylosifermentans]|uniref:PIN domain-containing protein n=1 Tax=Scheffersomyces xylosifermentans TaxID=1304137 RepID=UPI00315DF172
MSLPSKYAPEGLSREDQSKTITSGHVRPRRPVNYTIRTIEDRIADAVENQTYINTNYTNGDIEMVPMDDHSEVDVISEFVNYSRSAGSFALDDDSMEGIVENSSDFEITEGNISYLVVDTNFILSHLNIIDEIKNIANEYQLKLFIPITVMHELDGLKNSKRITSESDDRISGKSVGHLARWANDWIFSSLSNNSTVVKGQKLRERLDKNSQQDDAILDSALYLKERYPNSLVVLFSNDKNLCLKALSNEILTVSFRKHMTAKLIAETIFKENIARFGVIQSEKLHIQREVPAPISANTNQEKVSEEQVSNVGTFSNFHEVSQKVYQEIQIITLSAVHHCMETAYGDDLDLIRDYDKESIKTLHDCSQVFIRFWLPVFSTYFKSLRFVPFEESGERRHSKKTPMHVDIPSDAVELHSFLAFWSKVLTILYAAEMDENQNSALEMLIKRWEKMATIF